MDIRETSLIALAIICIAAVLLAPVACTMNRQAVIERAVQKGADPIAMKCALEATSNDSAGNAMCALKAAGK
jgi:hypothetical protein